MTTKTNTPSTHEEFMSEAIRLAIDNIDNNGGPFGAVIVKDGRIVGVGANRVTANNDPTAHAEVMAIRDACKQLGTFDLDGCTIYSSCEPCPMCLSAIYWAGITEAYYGCNKFDAAGIGFDDKFIYDQLALPEDKRQLQYIPLLRDKAIEAFRKWENKTDKIEY
ncbi:MAG: nucleoside deaminase [Rikenellaceae bacterium]|nr:nucleoside deaminase [Rikenellaceae bacterium]